MRQIIVQEFISLDGVMQSPGAPEEDPTNEFKYGGWTAPFFYKADEEANEFMQESLKITDLLLGRITYDIFAAYWPEHEDIWPGVNGVRKYVVSRSQRALHWSNSQLIFGDVVSQIKALKQGEGSVLKVIGSGNFTQTLLKHDLVDSLWLMIYPITLGKGKRLFGDSAIPTSYKMTKSLVASNGVIFANYDRAGEVETGIVGG